MVYGTGEAGHFFYYSPCSGELEYMQQRIPSMTVRRDWNTAECLCSDGQKNIYGGTTDGFLFGFSLETGKLKNFGKPSLERPIRGISVKEGVIYGVCGENDGIADMFSYDIADSNFTDLGMINYIPCEGGACDTVARSPWSAWRIGPTLKDRFGTLYLGEQDSKSHLFSLVSDF